MHWRSFSDANAPLVGNPKAADERIVGEEDDDTFEDSKHGRLGLHRRAQDYDAEIISRWVLANITEAEIESHQGSPFLTDDASKVRIRRSGEISFVNGIRFTSGVAQSVGDFNGQVLIDLGPHRARPVGYAGSAGTRSLARSAA